MSENNFYKVFLRVPDTNLVKFVKAFNGNRKVNNQKMSQNIILFWKFIKY